VERVGLPFPVDNYTNLYGNLASNEKEFIGLGVGAADNDRNFVSNILAFRKLQLKNPNLVGIFLSVPPQLMPFCAYWADRLENVFIHERTDMSEFYEMLSRCKFVISLADRNTPGRLQGEAAFFGVPVIGSDRLELQRELFPYLSVSPYSIEQAVELGQWVIDTPKTVNIHVEDARAKLLSTYNYKQSLERYNNLLARIEAVNDK
jgi:glycosyltransferase involved in cell wall biosynthesis